MLQLFSDVIIIRFSFLPSRIMSGNIYLRPFKRHLYFTIFNYFWNWSHCNCLTDCEIYFESGCCVDTIVQIPLKVRILRIIDVNIGDLDERRSQAMNIERYKLYTILFLWWFGCSLSQNLLESVQSMFAAPCRSLGPFSSQEAERAPGISKSRCSIVDD